MQNPAAEPSIAQDFRVELSPTALLYLARARGADGRRRRINRR
jgi:hypothetical protein